MVPSSFLQYKTYKLVYRRYAGLYFIFCIDVTDNELIYLETIHLFVEVRPMHGHSLGHSVGHDLNFLGLCTADFRSLLWQRM